MKRLTRRRKFGLLQKQHPGAILAELVATKSSGDYIFILASAWPGIIAEYARNNRSLLWPMFYPMVDEAVATVWERCGMTVKRT